MTRYSKEERLTHIELWQESGLSRRAYSEQAGIKYGTFKSWFEKRHRQGNSFIPLEVSPQVPSPCEPTDEGITINYPNGIIVNCPCDIAPRLLAQLLSIQ